MKERPILFSAPMVQALLDGSKTQTRRVVKLPHQNPLGVWEPTSFGGPNGGRLANGDTVPEQGAIWHTRTGECLANPYGQPGDQLWVREAWRTLEVHDHIPPREMDAAYRIWYEPDTPHQPGFGKYRPGMFMPRWASRITLEITGVSVERLQEINEADALAEGIDAEKAKFTRSSIGMNDIAGPVAEYSVLWEAINGPGSWDVNPWVWVVEFKRIAP